MGDVEALAGEVAYLRAEIQSLRSEIAALSGAGAGGGDGADVGLPLVGPGGSDYGTFRLEGDKITHCNFYAQHNEWKLDDVEAGNGNMDGTWYLNVPHDNPSQASVSRDAGPNDDDNTRIRLFTVKDGDITEDYRGMPFVPIYA